MITEKKIPKEQACSGRKSFKAIVEQNFVSQSVLLDIIFIPGDTGYFC